MDHISTNAGKGAPRLCLSLWNFGLFLFLGAGCSLRFCVFLGLLTIIFQLLLVVLLFLLLWGEWCSSSCP